MYYVKICLFAVLAFCLVGSTTGLECLDGSPFFHETVNCSGSCLKMTIYGKTSYGCFADHKQPNGCQFFFTFLTCYCNTDECNDEILALRAGATSENDNQLNLIGRDGNSNLLDLRGGATNKADILKLRSRSISGNQYDLRGRITGNANLMDFIRVATSKAGLLRNGSISGNQYNLRGRTPGNSNLLDLIGGETSYSNLGFSNPNQLDV